MARRNTRARSRDMVISMAVLLVPIIVIVWWFTVNPDPEPEAVDVDAVLGVAVDESPYPLLRSEDPGEGWTPVRVAWAAEGEPWITNEQATGNWWQVGYLSPDEVYFGVQQRDGATAAFVDDVTRDGDPLDATLDVAGLSWERYESADGRTRSLVSVGEDVTAVVTADTDFVELEAFAATLTAVGG